jgi:hypothetical protein
VIPTLAVQYSGDAPGMVKGVFHVNFKIQLSYSVSGAAPAEFYLQVGNMLSDSFLIYVE